METMNDSSIDLFNKYYELIKGLNKSNHNINDLSMDSMINEMIEKISENDMNFIVENQTKLWLKIVKKTLKISLNEDLNEEFDHKLLQSLFCLINKLSENKTSLERSLDLICGHSMFNNILIEDNYKNSKLKNELISVLCVIYEKDNNLCNNKNEIIEVILSAYNCSMRRSDQQLLQLLSLLEKNSCNLYKYQPFLWGINAAIHYSIKKKEKSMILKEPKIEDIFSAFNENDLRFSLNNFPIELTLNPIQVVDVIDGQSIYDPRFVLPLLYHLLSSQSIVKCHKFVSYGALSYAIVSLSSSCASMRSLAYCVLSRFYDHLIAATFPRDRFLWIAVIDYIRSGITCDNMQLKSLIAVFIVRLIDILLHPNDKLYEVVKPFMVSRPTLESNALPPFYDIINSSDVENHKRFQRFIICWICDGLRTEDDIKLCLKRNVFSEMLALFDSPLCDQQNQVLILQLLSRCCRLYLGSKVLCTENALFCWLKNTIFTINDNPNASLLINEFYNIVCNIWQTISARNLPVMDVMDVMDESNECQYLLYPSFCFEIIDVFRLIIKISPQNDKVAKYSQICKSIFTYFPNLSFLSLFIIESLPQNMVSVNNSN